MSAALVESGLDYCREHDGVRETDEDRCDFADDDEACDLTPLLYEAKP